MFGRRGGFYRPAFFCFGAFEVVIVQLVVSLRRAYSLCVQLAVPIAIGSNLQYAFEIALPSSLGLFQPFAHWRAPGPDSYREGIRFELSIVVPYPT